MMKSTQVIAVLCFMFYAMTCTAVQSSLLVGQDVVLNRMKVSSNTDVIPTVDTQPLNVSVGYSLVNILSADVDHNELEILVWMTQSWMDKSLSWQFTSTNFSRMSVPTKYIWTPDITFYNAVAPPEVFAADHAVVHKDGRVTYVTQVRVRFMCDLKKMTAIGKMQSVFTKSDGTRCTLKSTSWTHSSEEMVLTPREVMLSEYFESSKFHVLDASQKVHQKVLPTGRYEALQLSIDFKRK